MKILICIFSISLYMLLASCGSDNKYPYAIRDFSTDLQPKLTEVVSTGIVGYDPAESYIKAHIADKDLIKLSKCEHPVLRAFAFREMLTRKSFNHFDLMMNNLDDTAIVATYAGEWGIWYRTVSDDMLGNGHWKDSASRNKTIDAIIKHHNYLRSAYIKLQGIQLKSEYYPYIKEMARHNTNYNDESNGMTFNIIEFNEIEYALYALAGYKKKEDIEIIKDLLMKNSWRMTDISYRLMSEYPNDTYLDVFEKLFPGNFYRLTYWDQSTDKALSFIKSIATYKNETSAKILSDILNRKPFMPYPVDTASIKEKLIYAIWNNPCKAYEKMRKQIESKVKEYDKSRIQLPPLPLDESVYPKDTSSEPLRW